MCQVVRLSVIPYHRSRLENILGFLSISVWNLCRVHQTERCEITNCLIFAWSRSAYPYQVPLFGFSRMNRQADFRNHYLLKLVLKSKQYWLLLAVIDWYSHIICIILRTGLTIVLLIVAFYWGFDYMSMIIMKQVYSLTTRMEVVVSLVETLARESLW